MLYFESKHIHSCLASASSDDVWITRPITRAEFLAHEGEKTVSRKHGFSIAYADADKKFYDARSFLSHAPKDKLWEYVGETYLRKEWSINDSFLKAAQRLHWKDEELATKKRREKQGYVIPEWSQDIPPRDYQGGFSDDVFFSPELYDYVKSGGCHGFIGHSVRKPQLDAYFEARFLSANPDKSLLAMWLTSTGGRHFGDSLEGFTFAQQKRCIRKEIPRIIAEAKRYEANNAAAA